ncbi:hypothetical protein BS78_04G185800 [Paspalum vaginatum]|nr:hypothetical protein BS78_04G185800 [Paspalum vaginatum]
MGRRLPTAAPRTPSTSRIPGRWLPAAAPRASSTSRITGRRLPTAAPRTPSTSRIPGRRLPAAARASSTSRIPKLVAAHRGAPRALHLSLPWVGGCLRQPPGRPPRRASLGRRWRQGSRRPGRRRSSSIQAGSGIPSRRLPHGDHGGACRGTLGPPLLVVLRPA